MHNCHHLRQMQPRIENGQLKAKGISLVYWSSSSLPVMSTNIQIFEYSNKMAFEYYSYLYSWHFPSMNIFGYSFVDFWTTKYIWIFVHKFSKIRIYLNSCSEPYFNIRLSIFIEKVYLDIFYASKISSVKFYSEETWVSPFKKFL